MVWLSSDAVSLSPSPSGLAHSPVERRASAAVLGSLIHVSAGGGGRLVTEIEPRAFQPRLPVMMPLPR
jgi:hypothetical protein